ncbi:MAG: A24 family peptidase [bacterium]
MHYVVLMLATAWAATLCWFDLRERRLPNWLTIGGAMTVLVARFGYGGVPILLDGMAAGSVASIVLLLPFLVHGAGGGDVKMLFASGAIAGWAGLFPLLWTMSLTGLALGSILLVAGRLDGSRLRHYALCAFNWRYDRRAGAAAIAPRNSEKVRMPFSIPIAAGLVAALLGGMG